MAKYINDLAMDADLDYIADATRLCICEGQPASYAEATTNKGSGGKQLGGVTIDGADFSKDNGDGSGRKLILAAQNAIPVDVSGSADHYAIVKATGSVLKLVGTLTLQVLTAGNTMNFPATDVNEVGDPT